MDFASSIVKKEDTNWRPLILNVQCVQAPLTEVPSVLSLYPFDIISPGAYVEYLGCSTRNVVAQINELEGSHHSASKQTNQPVTNATPSSIMTAQGVVISKEYGIKSAKNSQDQIVLLRIASPIMLQLLCKYPDLLAVDSTSCRNGLNFPNTVFIVRSDKPHGRVAATFISDKETITVANAMFERDPYLVTARKHFPNTQILCDWHEANALKE
ncbi:hypothetical protein F8M41_011838 [Gigaspora margarita]|uniref:Uncharacterized protein n=1 Tax=Gigaspora margarita TaxID=4874 RepID=A0A8H4EPY0_GIGMA|nr:hypothetical protein F8M41_011838 [Gigaspora margarita]